MSEDQHEVGRKGFVSFDKYGVCVAGDIEGLGARDAIHWAIAKLRERLKPSKEEVEAEKKKYMEESIAAHDDAMKARAERFGMDHTGDAGSYKSASPFGWCYPTPHCAHGVSLNVKCSACAAYERLMRPNMATLAPNRTPATPRAIYEGKYYVDVKRGEYCDNCGKTFEDLISKPEDPRYVATSHVCEYKGERLATPGWTEEAKKWEQWHVAQADMSEDARVFASWLARNPPVEGRLRVVEGESCSRCGLTFDQLLEKTLDPENGVFMTAVARSDRSGLVGRVADHCCWGKVPPTLTEKIDEEVLSEFSQADTECLCGGPPGHVPGGMNCRK
jgi:hypothetical protein